MGALVEKIVSTNRRFKQLECLAAIGLLVTVYLMSAGFTASVHDTSPFFAILSIGIYIALLRWGSSRKRELKIVSFIAKHSFSIYLVHMMILTPLARALPQFTGVLSIVCHIGITLVAFALSLIVAAALDRLVMDQIKRLFDKTAGKLITPKAQDTTSQ